MMSEIKIEDEFIVDIVKQDHFGNGITKVKGMFVFVKDTLPGEKCKIVITDVKKTFCVAKVKEMIKEADIRVPALCRYYDVCGGCDIMHQNYDSQLEFKVQKVRELLSRYAEIDDVEMEPICYGNEFNYRNKVVFHGLKRMLGFYKEKSHDLVMVRHCLLAEREINMIYTRIIEYLNQNQDENISELMIRKSSLDEVMIVLEGELNKEKFISFLQDFNLASVILNGRKIFGQNYITEKIFEMEFRILPGAFFQVNYQMMLTLYQIVLNFYKGKNYQRVLDLYCGTGTIGLLLSSYVEQVIGVEISKDAIEAAKMNQEINGVKNIQFYHGDVEKKISEFKNIDSIVVDPPRSGLDPFTIQTILEIGPSSIVYISCDPVTLSRDLKSLLVDYKIEKINLVDMFPNTSHVESVVFLEKLPKRTFRKYDVLVNNEFPYKEEDYNGMVLVKTKNILGEDIFVEEVTYEHYLLFRDALKELGILVNIVTGYQSLDEQEMVLEKISKDKKNLLFKDFKIDTNEHLTGLALDITVASKNEYQSKDLTEEEKYKHKEKYELMSEFCADYGFIVRYPKGKKQITNHDYEPEHFRYVGRQAAKIIMNEVITLEEYLGGGGK